MKLEEMTMTDLQFELGLDNTKNNQERKLQIENEILRRKQSYLEVKIKESESSIGKVIGKFFKFVFLLIILAVVLFFILGGEIKGHVYPNNYKLELPTGEEVLIEKFIEMYAGGDDAWMLAVQYKVDDISNLSKLCENARMIWPHLKPYVEKKGWDWGTIKAAKRVTFEGSDLVKRTGIKAYSISFHRTGSNWKISSESDVCE